MFESLPTSPAPRRSEPPVRVRSALRLILCMVLALAILPGAAGLAQAQESEAEPPAAAADETSIRELIENEQKADELIRQRAQGNGSEADKPRTPLQLTLLLAEASGAGDFEAGARFLDMRYLPEDFGDWPPADLLAALRVVWEQQNLVDVTQISDEPEGKLDDGLPVYRDLLGEIRMDDGESVPVYLQRIPDGEGGKIWKISNATVAQIPRLWADLGYGPIAVWLQRHLPDIRFAGMYSWQLIASVIFAIISWPLAGIVSFAAMRIALLKPNEFGEGVRRFFRQPLRLFLFVVILRLLMDQLGLSLTARVYLNSSGVDFIAFSILLLGLISLVRDYHIKRLEAAGNRQYVALLKPFTTIVKFVALVIIALIWADRAGYNMSTIIAGLGVGSLAVALAAQKTLENVIGAITLYSARPVNPGDLCRFGNIVGVVEEIGLRSTLIRTLNRTMLAVPNSVFSSVEVENFSHRDRIRYFQQVELQISHADQLRLVLLKLRELFLSHADVLQDSVSVRLEKIAGANVVIRIDAHVLTTDYQRFLAVAEDLNLRMIEVVQEAGAQFSGPGQLLQLRDYREASEESLAEMAAELHGMQSADDLPFPDYSDTEKSAMRGTIELRERGKSS